MDTCTAEPRRIAGIVLAGGLSSRMGQDKALLRWAGETLLERSIRLLREAGAETVRVSGPYPAHGGIVDQVERCGPVGGLFSVLSTLQEQWAWVVAVDMPRLQVGQLHQLRDAAPALCVRFTGEPLPMLLYIDENCRTLLAQMVLERCGPRSLKHLQQRLGVHEVPISGDVAAHLVNCNTPGQWEDAVT